MINTSSNVKMPATVGDVRPDFQDALDRVQANSIAQGLQGRRSGSENLNNESAVMLRAFRHNHPYTTVQPLPVIRTVVCDATQQVVNIPSGAIAVKFTQAFGKNVVVGITGGVSIGAVSDSAWINPGTVDGWFICHGKLQFDVSGEAGAVLSAMFYIQDDLSGALPHDAA